MAQCICNFQYPLTGSSHCNVIDQPNPLTAADTLSVSPHRIVTLQLRMYDYVGENWFEAFSIPSPDRHTATLHGGVIVASVKKTFSIPSPDRHTATCSSPNRAAPRSRLSVSPHRIVTLQH